MEEGIVDIVEITIDAEGKSISSTIEKDVSSIIASSRSDNFADSFTAKQIKGFIDEVQKHPVLWKVSLSGKKNNLLRGDSWTEISGNLDTEETVLKRLWQEITDSYAQCRNQTHLKTTSYTDGGKLPLLLPKTCSYYDELSFLKDGFLMTADILEEEDEDEDEEEEEGVCSSTSVSPLRHPISLTPSASSDTTLKRKCADASYEQVHEHEHEHGHATPLRRYITSVQHSDEDSDLLFCKSLACALRDLPKRRNALIKMKIQEILFKAQFDENFDTSSLDGS